MVEIRRLQPLVKVRPVQSLKLPEVSRTAEALKPVSTYPRHRFYAGKANVRANGRERFFLVIERRNRDFPPPTPQPTPCILWQGSLDRDGYGRITKWIDEPEKKRRRQLGVHRHIMEVFLQRVLRSDEIVLHACDNRLCYRIDHLSIGTTQDNTADMVAKGRNSKPPKNVFHGEDHPMAKFSADRIATARALYQSGVTQKKIAETIGMSKSQVQRIVTGKAWVLDPQNMHENDYRMKKEGSVRWKVREKEREFEQGVVLPPYR